MRYTITVLTLIVQLFLLKSKKEGEMFEINGMSSVPVYEQLINQVEKYVAGGILVSGSKLPSVRNLSVSLSVNPNTVQKAFTELTLRKIICGVPGKGNFITEDALKIVREKSKGKITSFEKLAYEMMLAGVEKEELLAVLEKVFAKKEERFYD